MVTGRRRPGARPRSGRQRRYAADVRPPIDRRTFLKLSTASAAGVLVGSLGCAGSGSSRPVVSTAGAGRYLYFEGEDAVLELRPWQHRLVITRQSGETVTVGGLGSGPGQLNAPAALAVGPDGLVYVADRGNHRVQVFTLDGALVRSFGSYGTEGGQLSYPAGVGFDGAGRLLVSDTRNHRIAVHDAAGALQGYLTSGSGGVALQGPLAIASGPRKTVHVVDAGNARVQVYGVDLSPLHTYGRYGTDGGRMILPQALAVAEDGMAYVGDVTSPSILAFDGDGIFRERLRLEAAPVHLALAPDGSLVVTGCSPV
jgi:DNA-binding beta-propeller fold protein YncE